MKLDQHTEIRIDKTTDFWSAVNTYRWATLICLLLCFPVHSTLAEDSIDFNRDVRPLLSKHCFACHGPDENSREADLRLDTREGAITDLGEHQAIQPGKPQSSELIRRINSDDPDNLMPPPDTGHQLTVAERRLIEKWIAEGANYSTHWSFIPPQKSTLPKVSQTDWPSHAIDAFALARLEETGLSPAAEANRYELIRRVSLDLTGLPPTPEEADAFVNDPGEDAFEKVVDRLLQQDSFGEHWARMWLDLARYADTKGYEKDRHRDMWPYRDWVIQALNEDMPFDQFTREQLAGDLLPEPTQSQLVATAFHRNTMTNDEGGTDNEEFRVAAVKDRVDTTIQVWMGLTMACAKCHSHKYDPISHDEYYSFLAYFNQTEDADRGDDSPVLQLPTEVQTTQIAELNETIKSLNVKANGLEASDEKTAVTTELESKKKELATLKASITKLPIMRELPDKKQRESRVHVRGNFLDPGDLVEPSFPALFPTMPAGSERNRLSVADWLFHADNPLTARVMVNRVWARLFGVGIVETEEDFGSQGTLPSHPKLLDWLAVEFREQGWSLKHLIRTIVLTSTYRQSAVTTSAKLQSDPNNRLFSRGPRFRLSAETVRDQALAVAGLLTHRIGGPSVMPPQPPGVWKSTYSALKWENAPGPDRYRRGIYTYWKRTSPYPAMITFDAGSGEVCLIRRIRTNTPLQALVTLNDLAFVEAAGGLARRMAEFDGPLESQLTRGFRLVLTRPPTSAELERLTVFYITMKSEYAQDEAAVTALLKEAKAEHGDAALVSVANVLLNLDETMVKP